MIDDFDRCYAALSSRDARFDGWVYFGVTSTGIYCRPSCPAVKPKRQNVRVYATSAAALGAGFRACRRCRPDTSPGSPEWDARSDLVGRAMRAITDGVVDRDGVSGLAAHLGYSARQVHRELVAAVGAGPLALARAERARSARVLIETTSLALADVAFASGFASVRQFNDTVRSVFGTTPSALRAAAGGAASGMGDVLTLRLAYREPGDVAGVLAHLAARAVDGVEEVTPDGTYRRSLALPRGAGIVELSDGGGHVAARLRLDDLRDLTAAVQRCRRLLDLDADPVAVAAHLARDPALAPLVAAVPGRRVPGAVDGTEAAVRTVVGQQVSVAAARTLTGRVVARAGSRLDPAVGTITHCFPSAAALAEADLTGLGLTGRRTDTLRALGQALAGGSLSLDPAADRAAARTALLALPGIGPWTADYLALRALGDPDAFCATDLVLRRTAGELGLPADAAALTAHADSWRPWRAYAAAHLWSTATEPPAIDHRRPAA